MMIFKKNFFYYYYFFLLYNIVLVLHLVETEVDSWPNSISTCSTSVA